MILRCASLLLTVAAIFSGCCTKQGKQAPLPPLTSAKPSEVNELPTIDRPAAPAAPAACAHPECQSNKDPLGHCLHEHLIFDELDCPECAYDVDCPECNPLNNPLS